LREISFGNTSEIVGIADKKIASLGFPVHRGKANELDTDIRGGFEPFIRIVSVSIGALALNVPECKLFIRRRGVR
jgi:hypothetical protein